MTAHRALSVCEWKALSISWDTAKVKCRHCYARQVWWNLHWVLRPGWAGGLLGLQFFLFLVFSSEGTTWQPQYTELC